MLRARRIEFVDRLMSRIELIGPATLFEPFGGLFMKHWKGVEFIATGINALDDPLKGNADLISADGKMAAEFSALKTYFTGSMKKLRGDFEHSRKHHPQAAEVYLLSSQVASTKQRQAFPRIAAGCQRKRGALAHVLDARLIAELIVDNLLYKDLAVDELSQYLPELKRIQDEYASSDAAPPLAPNHVARQGVQDMISGYLKTGSMVSIVGVAGNGKSECAAAFAQAGKGEFDLVMWLDANGIEHLNELKGRQISRVGEQRNVVALLMNNKALLVLDDLGVQVSAADLTQMCGAKSKVIITRRDFPSSGPHIDLALMTTEEATQLLNSGEGPSCPDAFVTRILDSVGGHPFSLSLMNAFVRSGTMSWQDVRDDCAAGSAAKLADSQGRIADRILSRGVPKLERELEIFRWIERSRCHRGWFAHASSKGGEANLRQHGLFAADRSGVIRLHDIVFASVMVKVKLTPQTIGELIANLNDYIESIAYKDDLTFTSLAFTFAPKLDDLVSSGVTASGIVYAWLRSWDAYDRDLARLGDPLQAARDLAARSSAPRILDVAAILEAVEIKYRHLKDVGTKEAREWLRAAIDVYDVLAAIPRLHPRSVVDILHHRGKALNLTFQKKEAIVAFEAVLSSAYPLYEARLQLARLYGKDEPERAVKLASEVFEAAREGSPEVTSSVLLATAEALPMIKLKGARRQLMDAYGEQIEARLVATVETGSDQAFTNFASVGRDWAWHEPERYARVYKYIPTRALDDVKRDNDRFTYADIRREGAETALTDPVAKEAARVEALAFFKAIKGSEAFYQQKLGQLYVEWGKYQEAADTLEGITPSGIDSYRKLWLSKAYGGLGRTQEAFDLIDQVVKATSDDDNFASTFYAQRFEARHALGDAQARDDLDRAIELSTSDVPCQRLIERKEAVFGKTPPADAAD